MNSLSDILDASDVGIPQSRARESFTVSTKDSIKKSSASKKSKRGGKKKNKSGGGSESNSNLDDLLPHMQSRESKFKATDCGTVSTMDSVQRNKGSTTMRKTKRGGKKKKEKAAETSKPSFSLESSLSDLLEDVDDTPQTGVKESLTVSTKDSMQREQTNAKKSKRGGKREKKETLKDSLSLRGGPAPAHVPTLGGALEKLGGERKDFGRQADDNDTFCGLGTVGDAELAKAPRSQNSPRKAKTLGPPQPKQKIASMSYMMSNDDDDSEEDEEDLFEGFGANPFRMPSYLG